MRDSLGLRSVSMGASALVLSGLVFMAMNASWSVLLPQTSDRPIIASVTEREPPPVTPPAPPTTPPISEPIQEAVVGALVVPVLPDAIATTVSAGDVAYTPAILPEVVDPHWRRQPRDLARYYPARALQRGMEGAVTLDCIVNQQGRLGCAVATETPEGWGFAEAALRISRDYEMIPATRDGVPVEARYRMRVPFAIE